MAEQSPLTLSQLANQIKGRIDDAFRHNVFAVIAEIAELKRGPKAIRLVLTEAVPTGRWPVRMNAVAWPRQFATIEDDFERCGAPITCGMKVLLTVRVNYEPTFGLQLLVDGIDPRWTVGDRESRRRELVIALREEGLYDRNRAVPIPDVPQRLAVISSAQAAGFGDFVAVLGQDGARYRFDVRLFVAAVQGKEAPPSIIAAVKAALVGKRYDCIVIVRGGGAAMDLDCFDDQELCKTVCRCPLPVVVGIGHTVNSTVLDEIAHTSRKTPTDAAQFFVQRAQAMESAMLAASADLTAVLAERLEAAGKRLHTASEAFARAAQTAVRGARGDLTSQAGALHVAAVRCLEGERHAFEMSRQRLSAGCSASLREARNRRDAAATRLAASVNVRLIAAGQGLNGLEQRLSLDVRLTLATHRAAHAAVQKALAQSAARSLGGSKADHAIRCEALRATAERALKGSGQTMNLTERLVHQLDPANVLRRGYSITRASGTAIRSARSLHPGDRVTTTLSDGQFDSDVVSVKEMRDGE